MNGIALPWLAEVVVISWRTVAQEQRPPLPSELLATFVIFGGVSVVTSSQPQVGALFGWGIVVATFLNLFDPKNPGHLISKRDQTAAANPPLQYGKAS